jgi:hypothetical protein
MSEDLSDHCRVFDICPVEVAAVSGDKPFLEIYFRFVA